VTFAYTLQNTNSNNYTETPGLNGYTCHLNIKNQQHSTVLMN